MVEHEQVALVVAAAAGDDLDALRHVQRGVNALFGADPAQQRAHRFWRQPGADVDGTTVAVGIFGDGRLARIEVVGKRGQGVRALQVDDVGPQVARRLAAVPKAHALDLPYGHRGELFDPDAQELAEGGGIAAEADVLVGVDDAAKEGHDQHAAVGDIALELGGGFVVHHVEIGDEQHLVGPEVRVGEHKVYRDILRVQRPIILLHLLKKMDVGRRLGILFERPPALPVDKDTGASFDSTLGDHAELLELVAQRRDLAPDTANFRRPRAARARRGTSRHRPWLRATGRT